MQPVLLNRIPPRFVAADSWFFLTLCCSPRGANQLCQPAISATILRTAATYHRWNRWALHLVLLMPDHLHAVVGFPAGQPIAMTVGSWKRLTAQECGVTWQPNFFDHRLRPGESLQLKAEHIRQNPVRAGLVERAEDWPHFVDLTTVADRCGHRSLPGAGVT